MSNPYNVFSLLGLLFGLFKVDGDDSAKTASDYYTPGGKGLDSHPNFAWFKNPKAAYEDVKFRAWLLENFFKDDTGLFGDTDPHASFYALSKPPDAMWRCFSSILKPGDGNSRSKESDEFKKLTKPDADTKRQFESHLVVGMSRLTDGSSPDDIATLGMGYQRLIQVYAANETLDQSLELAMEWYLPFAILTKQGAFKSLDTMAHPPSLQVGLTVRRGKGTQKLQSAEPPQGSKVIEATALCFSASVPLAAQGALPAPHTIDASLREPKEGEEADAKNTYAEKQLEWKQVKIEDWYQLVADFVAGTQYNNQPYYHFAPELLLAPFNPIRFLGKPLPTKTNLREAWKTWKQQDVEGALRQTKKTGTKAQGESETKTDPTADYLSGQEQGKETVQEFLINLGLLKRVNNPQLAVSIGEDQDKTNFYVYPLKSEADLINKLKFWDVIREALRAQDGFPLLVFSAAVKGSTIEPAIMLASAPPTKTNQKQITPYGFLAQVPSIPIAKTKTLGWLAHFGGWFSGETDDDNWYRRLLPGSPKPTTGPGGIGIFPMELVEDETKNTVALQQKWAAELISVGLDCIGMTSDGVIDTSIGKLGVHLDALETRLLFKIDAGQDPPRLVWGIGGKLDGIRLSFGKKSKTSSSDPMETFTGGFLDTADADDEADSEGASRAGRGKKIRRKRRRAAVVNFRHDHASVDKGNITANELQDATEADDEADSGGLSRAGKRKRRSRQRQRVTGADFDQLRDQMDTEEEWTEIQPKDVHAAHTTGDGPRDRVTEKDIAAWEKGFGLSIGMLSDPSNTAHSGSFDIQMYDSNGSRGKVVWFPVNKSSKHFNLKTIGVGLSDVELGQAKLTLAATGGMSFFGFHLGLIGAGVKFPLSDMGSMHDSVMHWLLTNKHTKLDGLDFAFEKGAIDVQGGLLRHTWGPNEENWEIAGELRIATPAISIGAMGAFGPRPHLDLSKPKDKWLAEHTPSISFFLYAFLSAADGIDILGILQIKGAALGAGINRQVAVPPVEGVRDFSLVKIVMGDAGEESQPDDPMAMLLTMTNDLMDVPGWYFAAAGIRFSIVELIDCFALGIVQLAIEEKSASLEMALLGLARLKYPKSGTQMLYVELDLEADFRLEINRETKEAEGLIRFEADISPNTWIIDPSMSPHLMGGFAACVWFGGEHGGDFMVSIGGYYPAPGFIRPAHYPDVARLGFSWSVSSALSFSGGIYFAVTPSCIMAGGRFDANFHAGPVAAWFHLYANFLLEWKPFHYAVSAGISIHAELDLALFTLSITIGASVDLSGPSMHGTAHLTLGPISATVKFGDESTKPELVQHWPEIGRTFVDTVDADGNPASKDDGSATGKWAIPTESAEVGTGPEILKIQPQAVHTSPKATAQAAQPAAPKPIRVRADELELNVTTKLPAQTILLGEADADGLATLNTMKQHDWVGKSCTLYQTLSTTALQSPADQPSAINATLTDSKTNAPIDHIGVRPMGCSDLQSVCLLTISLHVEGTQNYAAHDMTGWTYQATTSGVSHALWSPEAPDLETGPAPDAKLINGAIVGASSLRPPKGSERGLAFGPFDAKHMGYFDLKARTVAASDTVQAVPTQLGPTHIQPVIDQATTQRTNVASTLNNLGLGAFEGRAKRFRQMLSQPLETSSV